MKKLLLSSVCASMLFACSDKSESPPSQSNAKQQTQTTQPQTEQPTSNPNWETIVVGSDMNFPPFQFKDELGLPTGFEVELLQAVAKASELNVNFIHTNRDTFEKSLTENTVQLFSSSIAINQKRADVINFSDPFLDYDRAIYLLDKPENANLTTVESFKGKTLAASRSFNTATDIVGSEDKVIKKETFFLALQDMYTGKVDGVLGDTRALQYFAMQHPEIKTRMISLGEEKREIAFALPKNNPELLAKINDGLEKVKANGELDALIQKWFGQK